MASTVISPTDAPAESPSETQVAVSIDSLYPLIAQILDIRKKEAAMNDLSKRRESCAELAPTLWYSFGVVASLLQEIVSIYPYLAPNTLTIQASNRACNSLALFQCMASHPDTKTHMLRTQIPLYLYPFLNTASRSKPYEYLRLTSLGVIGALVRTDDPNVVQFLIQTDIIPLCLRIMESGSDLSKTVATFIIQKILIDNAGLEYICGSQDRFMMITHVLSVMISSMMEAPNMRLVKHIVKCYHRLSDQPKAKEYLVLNLPMSLRDSGQVDALSQGDDSVKKWVQQLQRVIFGTITPAVIARPYS